MLTKVTSCLRLERAHWAQSGWPKLSMHGNPGLLGSPTNIPLVDVSPWCSVHGTDVEYYKCQMKACHVYFCVLQHYKFATHGLEATHEFVRPVGRKRHVR